MNQFILDRLKESGCSDGNCIFGNFGGMHTNGGCMCEREIRRQLGPKKTALIRMAMQDFVKSQLTTTDREE